MHLLVHHTKALEWNHTHCSCHTRPAHNARRTFTQLGSPTPCLTRTLSPSGSLLHRRDSINVWHLQWTLTQRAGLSSPFCFRADPPSYLHSKLNQPYRRERDVTKPRRGGEGSGKYGSAKAGLPLNDRHFDNHRLSSLSDQTCQREMRQQDSAAERTFACLPPLAYCTQIFRVVLFM